MKRGKKKKKLFPSAPFILFSLACIQSALKSFDSKREKEFTNCLSLFYKLQVLLTPEADA